ncbi:14197_t:CDS:1, partial [Gigaspora margarita]
MLAPPMPYYIEEAPTYLSGSEDSELTSTYTGGSKNYKPIYVHSNKYDNCELIPTYQNKLK